MRIEPSPAESPEPTLRHALRHVNRLFHARFRARLAEHGVTDAEYQALFALRRLPDMSSADLARWTGVTAQGANQVLKSLIDNGLVERHPSPTHGRILEARLTARGEAVIKACERDANALEELMCSELSEDEVTQLDELLRRCAAGLGAPIKRGRATPAASRG